VAGSVLQVSKTHCPTQACGHAIGKHARDRDPRIGRKCSEPGCGCGITQEEILADAKANSVEPLHEGTLVGGPANPSAECGICGAVFSLPESMEEHRTKAHSPPKRDDVNDPAHYGGKDNPYEVIKVMKAWGYFENSLRFNSLKYLARAGKKDSDVVKELKKAIYYINVEIKEIEEKK
jgi:hypothetical protein